MAQWAIPGNDVGDHEAAPNGAHEAEQRHAQLVRQEHQEPEAEKPGGNALTASQVYQYAILKQTNIWVYRCGK